MVGDLHLAIRLRVVAKSILMVHSIFLQESYQFLLYEVHPIIANEHPWDFKTMKYDLFEKLSHHTEVIGRASRCLHPFGDIIHRNQDKSVMPQRWERSYKVDAPNIKYLDFEDEVEGHLILPGDVSRPLAMITCENVVVGIPEQVRPKESSLEDLHSGLGGARISSIRRVMIG